MSARAFFDTNLLLYSLNSSSEQGRTVGSLMVSTSGFISVQVLNEFVSVARRKLKLEWPTINRALLLFEDIFPEVSRLTLQTHTTAVDLSRRYRYSIYDSLILASSLECGCNVLYSEDMQDGQQIGAVKIKNPFL